MKVSKILGYTLLGIMVLIIIFIFSLRLPSVQNKLKNYVVDYIEDKIKTDVNLDRIYVGFPNSIVLENLYLEGQKVDTLLYIHKLDLGLDITKLMNNALDINSIDLNGLRANVVKDKNGEFNFNYIIQAFSKEDSVATESKPWVISLDKIHLKDIAVNYNDLEQSNNMKIDFNDFETSVETFDIEKNNYAVNDILLDGLNVDIKHDLVNNVSKEIKQEVDSISSSNPLNFDLNKIKLTNINVDYADKNSKTYAKINFDELNSDINKLDLQNKFYDIENVLWSGANVNLKLYLPEVKGGVDSGKNINSKSNSQKNIKLNLDKFKLNDINIVYNNTAIPRKNRGIDFNHLKAKNLNFDLQDFKFNDGKIEGEVKSAKVYEENHLNLQGFKAKFKYADNQAYAKDFQLITDKSEITGEITLSYDDISHLTKHPEEVFLTTKLENTKIGFSDVLALNPSLSNTVPFNQYPNAILNLKTTAKGSLKEINIKEISVDGLGDLKLNAKGVVKNPTEIDDLFYDLNISELSASSNTIKKLAPKSSIPQSITIPSKVNIKGKVSGNTKNIDADLNIKTTDGNANLLATIDLSQKKQEKFNIIAELDDFNLGKVIQNKDLGRITGKINAEGVGFDLENANASINGQVLYVDYNRYRYNNLDLKATINQGKYDLSLNSKDQYANLNLNATGDYKEENTSVQLNGYVKYLDLNKLNFYDKPLVLTGNIHGNFSNFNPNKLDGKITINNFAISDDKNVYPLQQIYFEARNGIEEKFITLNSQFLDFQMNGDFKTTQIFDSLLQTVNSYYEFQPAKNTAELSPNQYVHFDIEIKDDELIRKFIPDLKDFKPITINGYFDADTKEIQVRSEIPNLTYGKNHIENGVLEIDTIDEAMEFNLLVDIINNDNIQLNQVEANGKIADNHIDYKLSTKDAKGIDQYIIAGDLKSINDEKQFSLALDGLLLNYERWNVNDGNVIKIDKEGNILADNFMLSNGRSSIKLQSQKNEKNSPLRVDITQFDLATLTQIIKKEELPASGIINGYVLIDNFPNDLTFKSNLNITKFSFFENLIGTIDAKINSINSDLLNVDVKLSENKNNASIVGKYNLSDSSADLLIDIEKLNLQSLEGFMKNQIKNSEGYLSGNLRVSGKMNQPSILGKINLNDLGFYISKTGSDFRNINEKIYFKEEAVVLNNFTIHDNDGNELNVNGKVFTKDFTDLKFDLNVKSREFKIVDSDENTDQLLFGKLAVNTDLHIGGNLDLPIVNGSIAVADNSDFTFVVPQDAPTLQEREGIVRFVDRDKVKLQKNVKLDSLDTATTVKGLDVNVDITVNQESKISMIIDKATGDNVKLQGDAQLTGGIDPSGKTTLVGVFRVEKGTYELNVSMLNRKFDLQKGSTITWNGNPKQATLDFTAIYKTNASPIDLLQQQLSGLAPSEYNIYKQQIPFNTLLKMRGDLLKPIITFDITIDKDISTVATSVIDNTQNKLEQLRQDESEMNKQVFALLLLNRFIGENPFETQSGVSAGTVARQSVSRILSQQLNSLASDLIGGVDLEFDLNSYDDYSQGDKNTRTDLNIGLSKRLLNDRLKITIGSKFGLEGDARKNEELNNIAGDVNIDYMLSKNGRYILRAFRTNQYEVALQGQIVETGVAFIITLEYNKFMEIFKKLKKVEDKNYE